MFQYTQGDAHEDVDCFSRAPLEESDTYVDRILAIITPLNKDDWRASYGDDESQRFIEKAESGYDNFELRDGLIYLQSKLFVPAARREQIMKESHDCPSAAHEGVEGATNRLSYLWWPKMTRDVQHHVATCKFCQFQKAEMA